jgi:AraC-like DNA-binding protein
MVFASIEPSPPLTAFVRDYLIAHFRFDGGEPIPHKRYVPKPEQGITFFARGRPRIVDPVAGDIQVAPAAAVFGQQMKRCDVHLSSEFLMFRVHFQPGALFRVLNVPLVDFGESYFDAELVLGSEAGRVSERVAAAASYAGMVNVVETYLLELVGRGTQRELAVDRVAARLADAPVLPDLDELARQACLSVRQFNRRFTERVGVGPKLYGRVLRFHRTRLFKAMHPGVSWPSVAIRCGYTDYQHMVRDFREFTSTTPPLWLQEDSASPEKLLGHTAATCA